ncbi:hypothetical protein HHI36_022500 [Cryptolaemus montrouzieri]|uniref:Uncharacterized protein n=1 Tax=Cryptolaemus montrouzieri TaxID=559131 RepID=A0ABD2N013_9CUCU
MIDSPLPGEFKLEYLSIEIACDDVIENIKLRFINLDDISFNIHHTKESEEQSLGNNESCTSIDSSPKKAYLNSLLGDEVDDSSDYDYDSENDEWLPRNMVETLPETDAAAASVCGGGREQLRIGRK